MVCDKEILEEIKQTVKESTPDATIVLYGSRARGDARPDSDWDILILLNQEKLNTGDYDRIVYPLFDLGWKLDTYISPKLYAKSDWEKRSFTPFYKNIQLEGIVL
jgi:predicted nucleotidyltransferase